MQNYIVRNEAELRYLYNITKEMQYATLKDWTQNLPEFKYIVFSETQKHYRQDREPRGYKYTTIGFKTYAQCCLGEQ